MPGKKFIAFDLGAESGRAIAGILKDRRIALDVLHRFPTGAAPLGDTIYWDQPGIHRELRRGLAAYSAKYGRDLDGVATDSWGVDFGLLDKDGRLVGNPVHYRDKRNEGMPEALFSVLSKTDLMRTTGTQIMQFNTIFQLFYMTRKQKHLLDISESLLLIADLQNYFFCGEKAAEYTLASTTQMLDAVGRDWATGLLKQAGLPVDILPQVVSPCSVVGQIIPSIAEECNVKSAPVIAPACHDTASAIAAVPAQGDDWLYLSSGTWSLLGAELSEPLINEKTIALNFTNEGGVDGTIRFLKNIMGLWLIQECKRQWEREGDNIEYATLVQMASEAKPFTAIINPNHDDFIAPVGMPARIGEFCQRTGQAVPQTKGEIIRTAMESLALIYRYTFEQIEELTGRHYSTLHIVGGGTQNKLLTRFTADSLGRRVIAGPVEGTALGNILMQAMAVGELASLAEAREILRNSCEVEVFEPSADRSAWEAAYGKFREIMQNAAYRHA